MAALKPYYESPEGIIYHGDALEVLKQLPDESVHCCVTSPPYWGLRDYGIDGQLGLEKTPEEYVEKLVEVFREVRRVLRDDGTLWLNLGDSYAGSWGDSGNRPERSGVNQGQRERNAKHFTRDGHPTGNTPATISALKASSMNLKPKDLVGIPWRVALALQADGWYLRSAMPWVKRSAMPESVNDRPASALEYMFLFTKSSKYYFDMDAIKIKSSGNTHSKGNKLNPPIESAGIGHIGWHKKTPDILPTRNFRNTDLFFESLKKPYGMIFCGDEMVGIDCNPQAMKEAHFATFPEKLIEPCILAGTSEKGYCVECGVPWERIIEKTDPDRRNVKSDYPYKQTIATSKYTHGIDSPTSKTIGWQPTCKCSFLSCNSCFTVIDGENITVKEKVYGEKGRSSEIRTSPQLQAVRGKISNLSKEQQVLQQEVRGKVDDDTEGRSGDNENIQGIYYAPQTGSSNGNKGRVCNGTPLYNGAVHREKPDKRGSGTSHQRSDRRQQKREPGVADKKTAQLSTKREEAKGNRVPPLQEKNKGSMECPVCGKEATYKSHKTTPCVILDCFGGAMTTAIVSHKHNRNFIMIELSKTYIDDIGIPRIEKAMKQLKLF